MEESEIKEIMDKLAMLNTVFSPYAPIESDALFFGRIDLLAAALLATTEKGLHVVIHGERGVGKTSFANILRLQLEYRRVGVSKITCNNTSTFGEIWFNLLEQLRYYEQKNTPGFDAQPEMIMKSLSSHLPKSPNNVTIDDLRRIFNILPKTNQYTFIVDEYDTIENIQLKSNFSSLIKYLSDNHSNICIVIVGVSKDVKTLIGSHQSIERCLRQIKMPRMSEQKLSEIIERGEKELKIDVDDNVKEKIIRFSQGFPHFTHLLSKYSFTLSIRHQKVKVTEFEFSGAVSEALQHTNESVRNTYHQAILTSKSKESRYKLVLDASAVAQEDKFGCFKTIDIVNAIEELTGQKTKAEGIYYHLGKLCKPEKNNIFEKVGSGNEVKYRFRNQLLKAFIRLRLHYEGKLT